MSEAKTCCKCGAHYTYAESKCDTRMYCPDCEKRFVEQCMKQLKQAWKGEESNK